MTKRLKQTLDEAFALIEAAAIKGERCPQSNPHGPVDSHAVNKLAHAGRIKLELYAQLGQGATRNAVIGKLHRKGLTLGNGPQMTPEEAAERRKQRSLVKARAGHMGALARAETLKRRRIEAAKQRERIAVVSVNDHEIPPEQRCSLIDLRTDSCRWPIGDPGKPGFFFCGATKLDKLPYCAGHCRIAYAGLPVRKFPVLPARRAA